MTLVLPKVSRRSRFLFEFDARACLSAPDQVLDAVTGHIATFSRASTKTALDANGAVRIVPHSLPAFQWTLDPVSGLMTPGLLLEDTRTNLVIQSDALATGWTLGGTAAASNAVGTYAGRPFSRLTGLTGGPINRAVTLTGNGTKAVSVLIKSNGVAGFSYVVLYDTTAATVRGKIKYTVAADGSITATASTGTLLSSQALADGVYRFGFTAPSTVAANVNTLYASDTGGDATLASVLMSGAQVEDAAFPSSLVPTTTATVTRSADALSFAYNALPRTMTVYVKLVDAGTGVNVAADLGVVDIGGNGAAPRLVLYHNVTTWAVNHSNVPAANVVSVTAVGDTVEMRGVLNADGSTTGGVSVNGATETTNTDATTLALEAAWNSANLYLNRFSASTVGFATFQSVRIAVGVQSLATMRAA